MTHKSKVMTSTSPEFCNCPTLQNTLPVLLHFRTCNVLKYTQNSFVLVSSLLYLFTAVPYNNTNTPRAFIRTRTSKLMRLRDPTLIGDPAFNRDPAFIWTWASEPRRLLEIRRLFGTRRLIEVLRYFTLMRTLPMCLPCAINLKAASTSSASNTVVCNGFTEPSRSPLDTRSWTVFQSRFPGSKSASSSMPWNAMLRRNTAVPIHKGHRPRTV